LKNGFLYNKIVTKDATPSPLRWGSRHWQLIRRNFFIYCIFSLDPRYPLRYFWEGVRGSYFIHYSKSPLLLKKNLQTLVAFSFLIILFSCKSTKVTKQPVVNIPEEIEKLKVEPAPETIANFLSEYLNLKYKEISFKKYIYVSVKHQRLYLIVNDSTIRKYSISTAKKGIGNKMGSNKTPHGLHSIKRKIGSDVPFGGILESRVYTGKKAQILTQKKNAKRDYVTTRIMWLQGEEPGINKGRNMDSYNRYIYIHGTPEEGFIGEPASHGCIRMKNKDVIELYSLVDEGTPILILKY